MSDSSPATRFACSIIVPFSQLANFKVLVADGKLQVACRGTSNLNTVLGIMYILYVDTDNQEELELQDIHTLEQAGCMVENIRAGQIDDILERDFKLKPV